MKESKSRKPILIAAAALGLLLYTAAVCTAAVAVDRRAFERQGGPAPLDKDYSPAPADPGSLRLGERITAQGECEFTVVDCAFSRRAFPPNAAAASGGYEASAADWGYVDLTVRYRHLGGAPADMDGIVSPLLAGAGGMEYGAFAVLENAGGSQFIEYADIAPMQSARLHYLFLVPEHVGEGAFEIRFAIAGQAYCIGFAAGYEEAKS